MKALKKLKKKTTKATQTQKKKPLKKTKTNQQLKPKKPPKRFKLFLEKMLSVIWQFSIHSWKTFCSSIWDTIF